MSKKKKPEQEDEAEEKASWTNPDYEHAISEVEALRAILGNVRKKNESNKDEENEINDMSGL